MKIAAPVVALTHARVIGGAGAPARVDQTPIIRDGAVGALDDASTVAPPAGATMALERAFARAGGMLIAGTDPTGAGGVVPGDANQRQIELLVEAGFSPVEAISIGTLNGAKYLGREGKIGSIAVGKQADLVVVQGDPSITIADLRRVEPSSSAASVSTR